MGVQGVGQRPGLFRRAIHHDQAVDAAGGRVAGEGVIAIALDRGLR
jgi:hypothetical protein